MIKIRLLNSTLKSYNACDQYCRVILQCAKQVAVQAAGSTPVLLSLKHTTELNILQVNPLKPNSSNCYTLSYIISDIRALWRSARSARVPEIKNGRLGLYGTGYLKCSYMMKLGFKGLK